jgi:hypothetical protein
MAAGGVMPVMTPRRFHDCAAPGCRQILARHLVVCRDHWLQIPQQLRDKVNAEYQRRPGSAAHLRAIVDAIHSLEELAQ